MRIIKLFLFLISLSMTFEAKIVKPIHSYIIDCIEPSDLSYDSYDNSFYCVSDEGYIFHYNFEGQTIRSKELDLRDIESIYVDSKFIYVVDERTRQVVILDKLNFKELNRKVVNYFGGANKGYEGITFNPKKDKWLLITEKSPVIIFELNLKFEIENIIYEPIGITEASSITYYNDYLWILGDEDRTVSMLDPDTYLIEKKWIVDVPTPEGIAFVNGMLYLVSDSFNTMYRMDKLY